MDTAPMQLWRVTVTDDHPRGGKRRPLSCAYAVMAADATEALDVFRQERPAQAAAWLTTRFAVDPIDGRTVALN